MAEPQKQENRMLSYGPFPNVEPYSLQPLSVHFVHDTPFITVLTIPIKNQLIFPS